MRNINSLKNTAQFREVYEKGKQSANSLLVLYALATDGKEKKLGLSVSKKVGNSVVRHRLARLIRESFLSVQQDLPEGITLVVVARGRAKGKNFSDISSALLYLCRKMNLVPYDKKNTDNTN